MSGDPLVLALRAAKAVVQNLRREDNFSLITLDDAAEVVIPMGPVSSKQAVLDRIDRIQTGGSTDLTGAGCWVAMTCAARRPGSCAVSCSSPMAVLQPFGLARPLRNHFPINGGSGKIAKIKHSIGLGLCRFRFDSNSIPTIKTEGFSDLERQTVHGIVKLTHRSHVAEGWQKYPASKSLIQSRR